ncbi:MAG TPA: KGG domain-containing protein [Candidatus Thermoplasmatota archaeon]|nr:KGG domain-containing protein [Candidatus Thermoplasmatota archaeon]
MAQDNQGNQGGGRGFAGMDKEKQREIASKGGQSSGGNPQNLGNVDRSEAGRKGGEAVVDKYGPEHMSNIGQKGGQSSGGNTQNLQQGRGQGNQGNASNLSQEDREKGGERSGGGQ